MAGRLAQAQQGLEHLDLRTPEAHRRDALHQRPAVVVAELLVELALASGELEEERLLVLLRQLPQHLLLGAAQDERPQRRRHR